MKVNVTANNITLTPDIYDYLDKKLAYVGKLVDDDSGAVAHIEVGKSTRHHKSGNFFEAKIQLSAGGRDFTAEATGESVYAAIDIMKDDISRELTGHKDKKITMLKRGGRSLKNLVRGIWPFGKGAPRE